MKTIGILLAATDAPHSQDLLKGMIGALGDSDCRLVCFACGTINSRSGYEGQRNVLYRLVDSRTIDLLMVTGPFSHNVSQKELAAFCQSFQPIPILNLSVALPDFPAVVIDNNAGMRTLMRHLLDYHGYQRMAFIGGPPGQQEAEDRKAVFLGLTKQAGLSVPEAWIIHGDYTRQSGTEAVRQLCERLDMRPGCAPFQGIVCANDDMARGAMDWLSAQGWNLPDDCFCTGFDDIAEAHLFTPSLTTVRQSLQDMAATAVRVALDILAGKEVPPLTVLETGLVIRASCGCRPHAVDEYPEDRLRDTLSLTESAYINEAKDLAQARRRMQRLSRFTESMLACDSFETLLENLPAHTGQIGFSGVWLSLFDDPGQPARSARLHLAAIPGQATFRSTTGRAYSPGELLPGGLCGLGPAQRILVVEALYSNRRHFGFLILSTDMEDSHITGTLRDNISATLQVLQLIEERKRSEHQLIQTSKMAALGSVIAGLAHEINTPLGVAVTAASYIHDEAEGFCHRLKSGPISRSELDGLLEGIRSASTQLEKSLSRVALLVSAFKQTAGDGSGSACYEFDAVEYTHAIVAGIAFPWKERGIELVLDAPRQLAIVCFPDAISCIISNLVENALLHAFDDRAEGRITIGLRDTGKTIQLWVADDGRGIPTEAQGKVFEPFFTTRRGQGSTGLGLHIVFNLVTAALGGTIRFASAPETGTRFDIEWPKELPSR